MAWLVLEDNPNRTAAFHNAAKLGQPGEIRIWRIAAQMIRELPELLSGATLLSLDHDLYKQSESDPDPGCGRDVANYLAKQKPLCPVIIHSTNTDAAWGMRNELTSAGWEVEIIHHLDEVDWIETRWLALARKLTNNAAGRPQIPTSGSGDQAAGRSGGCLCGAIRYVIKGEPLTLYACHCTDCQRRTGTGFGLSLVVSRDSVEVTDGEPVQYSATLADGRIKRGRMCAACGTRLWGESIRDPKKVIVQPGTLDDTSWLHPVAHIWTRSAQPWFKFPEGVVRFETQPAKPWEELFKLWRERAKQ